MKNEVSIKKIRRDAEESFRKGDYFCSEAIVSSIKSNFEIPMPDEMIAMASGFPIGIGKSKCVCGAVSGGVMCLGYFFGRTTGGDSKVQNTLKLANELQESFKNNHKVLCCKVLTHGMDMASGEHKAQCISFTGEIAQKAAQIIVRELGLVNIDE
ncbi:C-GCAxxG-C-C family protein [Clostridium tagluense]|uniref:C-GCAxxG-C-C family (seleno)protein n=1 Tax=Clostridium TaxID=1485 RepID=UPI0013E92E2D|nr:MULTISPECIES: C-GCAxxG-C-C family (seleno)protein [Clostridium]MBW9155244.1 C-GCAxxG-C-C family protein [Clostridium tagluense]MBZ9624861.1 C-GCAxxG-C-C family protein [Clostridium sp. FP2]MCB2312648.1 C-GCAxxG-C-C family protein [Clostridium tagluense]MCB2317414.1 C-GCAxxG-C-C family protein [Clostridium tagluense]MCB2322237.1 C-GCAxxG-C-C family protein [Clostridium tagluense]